MPNRLALEQSPYLLQHQDNPVDWFPWGDEAFQRARREDKPIFLSIGYSTCHWCHVMAHESFESQGIADVLTRSFVSIKVDREERPDVDRVYMTFVQATTGSGGWPMSVWLTPDLKPFYGGTYFPPQTRWGKPGFVDVLEEIARVWREERPKVDQSARSILERLRSLRPDRVEGEVPGVQALARATEEFAVAFDRRRGGFGNAPKFPRPSELLFLLREHARTGLEEPRDMALLTLRAMALGGMRDHLGGGFHRYSVDGDWRVPHFEKMLYDQAQLVLAYLEAAQLTGEHLYADVARDTLDYVRRDLGDPAGGFYSAEDADSVPPEQAGKAHAHKMEGAFYIWSDAEVAEVLGSDADVVRSRYGVLPNGNAPSDPQNEFTLKNLLYTARSLEEVARDTGRPVADVTAALARARRALFDRRQTRPRPYLDNKILTAWNGLMIAAFARAARVLDDAGYLDAARRAAEFVRQHLWSDGSRTLLRRYRQGDPALPGYAEDYAYLIWGVLELFQASGDAVWLDWARQLQARQDELFWDQTDGGWFSTTGEDPSVLLRLKEDYDGAEPAASSVGALNLIILAHLFEDPVFGERAERVLTTLGSRLSQAGRTVPMMLTALSAYHAGTPQIVVTGTEVDRAPLMNVLRHRYLPTAVVIPIGRGAEALSSLVPWAGAMSAAGQEPATAFVCEGFACKAPVTSPDALLAQLQTLTRRD